MKKGFSLLTAIMFIVLIATIGALALRFSTQTTKETSDVYLKAQAELLAMSATEYAILALSAHNHAVNCLDTITATYNGIFNINIELSYIGRNRALGGNLPPAGAACTRVLANNIATTDSDFTVVVDTYVETQANVTTEPIRIHRRTLQKL